MDIDLVALMKQAGVTVKDVLPRVLEMSVEDINTSLKKLWDNPAVWHEKKKLSLNDGATLSEDDWKYILRRAKVRCEELGGEFVDPTPGQWSFGPK